MEPAKKDSAPTKAPIVSLSGRREEDEIVLQPFTYIMQIPGKMTRAKLAHAFNQYLQITPEKLDLVSEIVQMLHNASLVLDDIEDSATLRRGIPVAHSIYGLPSAINAGCYAMFVALERVVSLNHMEAVKVYTEQILDLHRGQGMELYWRDNFVCPTEEEYKRMVMQKTGGLFLITIRLMQLFSKNKSDFRKLVELISLYLQIRDDYCSLKSKEYSDKKTYCEDLTEGKFSFPVIHAIRSHPEDTQVFNILRQRTTDVDVKRHCVRLLEKYGSFEHTRQVLLDIDKSAREEVKKLGNNEMMIAVIDSLYTWHDMAEND